MGNRPAYTTAEFVQIVKESDGTVGGVATIAGVCRETVGRYRRRSRLVAETMEEGVTYRQEEHWLTIEQIVRRLAKRYDRVYPKQVAAHLDFYRCEQTLRRDMMRLTREGRLIRVSHRGGYVPAR